MDEQSQAHASNFFLTPHSAEPGRDTPKHAHNLAPLFLTTCTHQDTHKEESEVHRVDVDGIQSYRTLAVSVTRSRKRRRPEALSSTA